MNYYRAYGWTIASTIELPTLASIEHQHIAAQLAQATLDQSLIELKIISTELWDEKQFAALTKEAPSAEWPDKPSQAQIWSFKQGAKMLFRYGERLEIGLIGQQFYVPERFHSEPLLPLLFSGNILSALSLYRGEPTLHASCVVKAGQAIAFAGPSGSGKTTLAASVLGSS